MKKMPDLPATKLLVVALLISLLPSTSWAVTLPPEHPSSRPLEHTSSNLEQDQVDGGRLSLLQGVDEKSIQSDSSRNLPNSVEELKKEIQSLKSYQGGLLKHVKHWRVRRDARTPWWKKFLNFSNKKGNTGAAADIILQPESDRRTGGRAAKLSNSKGIPGTTQSQRPPIEQPPVSNLTKMLGGLLPNTYFSKPRFRYPYYDRRGKGHLLYGYGEKELYEYSVFKPLEGYY